MRNVSDEVVEQIKTRILLLITFSPQISFCVLASWRSGYVYPWFAERSCEHLRLYVV